MNNAAHELLINEKGSEYFTENNILDITMSGDGSWQNRKEHFHLIKRRAWSHLVVASD